MQRHAPSSNHCSSLLYTSLQEVHWRLNASSRALSNTQPPIPTPHPPGATPSCSRCRLVLAGRTKARNITAQPSFHHGVLSDSVTSSCNT
eukprot:365250-Chlamydomonas_euryale.AAC.1